MIVKGATGSQGDAFADRVDRMYGSDRWRKILGARQADSITASAFRAEMVNLLRWQFETELGYRHTIRIPMTMKSGTALYDMVFATDHEAGLKIMSRPPLQEGRRARAAHEAGTRRAVGPRAPLRRLRRAPARMEERALLGSVRALVVALDACCRQRWHVVPGPAIELAAVGLWRPATPLLEEERDVGAQALVADVLHPLRLHRSGTSGPTRHRRSPSRFALVSAPAGQSEAARRIRSRGCRRRP